MFRRSGLTLVELVIVVIVVGILASIAVPRFTTVTEKGRAAEARRVMGMIRTAQESYRFDQHFFASSMSCLSVSVPTSSCNTSFYFRYTVTSADGSTYNITATRCTSGGKAPNGRTGYTLNMTDDGTMTGLES